MAVALEDVESCLPTEFLTAEDLLMDKENFYKNGFNSDLKPSLCFPSEFPYEFDTFGSSSPLSSPVESVMGSSTETESSDDDDFLAGLTRRLTQQLAVKPEVQLPPFCSSFKVLTATSAFVPFLLKCRFILTVLPSRCLLEEVGRCRVTGVDSKWYGKLVRVQQRESKRGVVATNDAVWGQE